MRIRTILLLTLLAATAMAFQWTNQKKEKPRDPNIRNALGIVTLPDDAPAVGAVVQLKNLKTLQVRSYITQADGKYLFQNLARNVDYELRADLKNLESSKRTLSMFDSRWDAVINLKLEPKGGAKHEDDSEEKKQ
jgi:hypothetical protein